MARNCSDGTNVKVLHQYVASNKDNGLGGLGLVLEGSGDGFGGFGGLGSVLGGPFRLSGTSWFGGLGLVREGQKGVQGGPRTLVQT